MLSLSNCHSSPRADFLSQACDLSLALICHTAHSGLMLSLIRFSCLEALCATPQLVRPGAVQTAGECWLTDRCLSRGVESTALITRPWNPAEVGALKGTGNPALSTSTVMNRAKGMYP